MAFADFLAASQRRVVILAELTPSLRLSGWSAVGGSAPNSYRITLTRFVATAAVPGDGVYRRCVGVRENGTDLSERPSIADVDANAGSWFWDEANSKLYVRTSSGADPDTFTVYQALVTFYVATSGVVLNRVDASGDTGIYYHPWLSGELPHLTTAVGDLLSGQTNTMAGSITLTNAHGFWNALIAADSDYTWTNKRVRLLLGGSYISGTVTELHLPRSQYVALRTMRIEDVSADELTCQFRLAPLARATERTVPVTPYFESIYPNLGVGVRGTKKWVGYGRATIRPDLTDTSGTGVWTVADAAYQTLFAVHSVSAIDKSTGVRTALTLTTDYTVDLTTCIVTVVNATYAWQNYDLEVDVTGKPDGAGGYLHTFAAIVKDLLQTFLNVPSSEIDNAAFVQAAIDAPEEISLWLKDQRSLASIFSTNEPNFPSLERSVVGTIQQTLAGVWTCWIWDPGYDASAIVSMQKEDFSLFRAEPKHEAIYSTVHVHFNRNHARNEWPVETSTDPRTTYLAEVTDTLDIYTFLRDASDAQRLAQRYLLVCGGLTTEVEFRERGMRLVEHLAGAKVLVSFAPAPAASGAWVDEPFELLRLEITYAPQVVVVGRLGNLKGIGRRIGHWSNDTTPDYSAASAAERAAWGWWTDANGFAVAFDPSSADRSIWW